MSLVMAVGSPNHWDTRNSLLYSYVYHLNFKINSKFESGKNSAFWTQKYSTLSQKYLWDQKVYKDPYICLLAHEQKWLCDDLLPGATHPPFGVKPWILLKVWGPRAPGLIDTDSLEGCCLEFIKETQARKATKLECECSITSASSTSLGAKGSELQWICSDLILGRKINGRKYTGDVQTTFLWWQHSGWFLFSSAHLFESSPRLFRKEITKKLKEGRHLERTLHLWCVCSSFSCLTDAYR